MLEDYRRCRVLCIVCLKVVVLTLAPGWAVVTVGSAWIIFGPWCLLKQQASCVCGGERSHTGSILRSKPASPFLSPAQTHTRRPDHPPTPPRLPDTKTIRLSPFPQ